MSISSKIKLDGGCPGSFMRFELDVDPIHCGDFEWDFILAVIEHLRDFEKSRLAATEHTE